MIAIDVELLTGRYVATSFNDRREPEWPPHPARLFSALVATAHEHQEILGAGRQALDWLEKQGAPQVLASNAERRVTMTVFVPENTGGVLKGWSSREEKLREAIDALAKAEQSGDDKAIKNAHKAVASAEKKLAEQFQKSIADDGKHNASACAQARSLLPEHRGKQPRHFPSVTPEIPRIVYLWPEAEPTPDTRSALADLARRMVRLGHSSSLVSCRIVSPESGSLFSDRLEAWIPDTEGELKLRTFTKGQLGRLETAYKRHEGFKPRVLPAEHQAYIASGHQRAIEADRSVFGEWFVFREVPGASGRRIGLSLSRTEDVTRALRGALLSHAGDSPPSVLSGHTPNGRVLDTPHAAFLALGDVSSPYATGKILGVALLLPKNVSPRDRRAILRAVGQWEQAGGRLTLGRVGALSLERIVDRDPRKTLDPDTWMRPSRRWASVTPIALDENPGDLLSRDSRVAAEAAERAEEIVARSCERIGLPRPAWVQVMRRSLFNAAPAARQFMPFPKKAPKNANGNAFRRVCVHAELRFHKPVAGPVLLGAGRYFGVGLCRAEDDRYA